MNGTVTGIVIKDVTVIMARPGGNRDAAPPYSSYHYTRDIPFITESLTQAAKIRATVQSGCHKILVRVTHRHSSRAWSRAGPP